MTEKMEDNPNYFFKETAFLRVFMDFLEPESLATKVDIDEPESLD